MANDRGHRLMKIGDRPINLTQVLKLAGSFQSGGEAKTVIAPAWFGSTARSSFESGVRSRPATSSPSRWSDD